MNNFSDKVIYQIYLKSFKDSNGDGIGDIRGITEQLDYLQALGVDYLWITPFFVSPQNDNGYDVADYRSIDPIFGTMTDLEELIDEAKKRGIELMLDMVFNHTSTSHQWFRKALAGDKKYQDYYIFKDGTPDQPPTNWESKFGGPAWEYVPHLKKWYLHLFDVSQADLNWENPQVREELKEVIRFWKEKGIGGFRFDVVNLISKPESFEDDQIGDGRRFYTDGRHVHEFLKELTADTGLDQYVTVGEMSSTSLDNCIRYSSPAEKELSMCFNFHHLKIDYKDGKKWELMEPDLMRLKGLFETWETGMQEAGGWNALFWCNHDQPRIVSRLGDEGRYWKESAKMLAASIHLMRGTPYIYQGEELGMTNTRLSLDEYNDLETLNAYKERIAAGHPEEEVMESLYAKSRDNARTPMHWNDAAQAGFTTGTPWLPVNPNYPTINAASQVHDEDSVFSYYKKLIRLRKETPVIVDGVFEMLLPDDEEIFAYRRTNDSQTLTVICNFYGNERSIDAASLIPEGSKLLISNYADVADANVLRPYEARMYLK